MTVTPVGDVVAGLGEGPVWHEGTLFWVDIPGGMLHRTDPATGHTDSRELGAPLALALPTMDGSVLVARGDDLLLLPPDGDPVPWVSFPHRENMRLNDGLWDQHGRLLVGTMVLPQREGGPAALWRVDADGTRHEVVGGLRLSNGVAWSVDGARLFHVDTPLRRLWAHDIDAAGDIVASTLVAEVEADVGNPDGITVDSEDHLWVCLFGGWAVRRYTPDGRVAGEVRLPVQHPTSCAFGGQDGATLFITTASNRLDDKGRAEQPLAGRLLAVRPGVTGHEGVLGVAPQRLTDEEMA